MLYLAFLGVKPPCQPCGLQLDSLRSPETQPSSRLTPLALTEIDRNLLKRCLNEEPGAWTQFVDRYIGLIVHVVQHAAHARSVKLQAADIDDLCSDVLLALLDNDFKALRAFQGRCSLATYLTVVARRVVIRNLVRRKAAEALGHVYAHQTSLEQADVLSLEQQRLEDREEVKSLIKALPPSDAAVVKHFHLEGMSYRQISERLGISENSIGPTLSRAREKLIRIRQNSDPKQSPKMSG